MDASVTYRGKDGSGRKTVEIKLQEEVVVVPSDLLL